MNRGAVAASFSVARARRRPETALRQLIRDLPPTPIPRRHARVVRRSSDVVGRGRRRRDGADALRKNAVRDAAEFHRCCTFEPSLETAESPLTAHLRGVRSVAFPRQYARLRLLLLAGRGDAGSPLQAVGGDALALVAGFLVPWRVSGFGERAR